MVILKRDNRTKPSELFVDETIFTHQNGYLGVRGNFEESTPYQESIRGTYINGFYDSNVIEYGERAYGYPAYSQTIVNLPDAQSIIFYVDEKPLDLNHCTLIDLKRSYDLKRGQSKREIIYQTPNKHRFKLVFKRLVHLKIKSLFIIETCIESLDKNTPITIHSTLNANQAPMQKTDDPRFSHPSQTKLTHTRETLLKHGAIMETSTYQTKLNLLVGMHHSKAFEYDKEPGIITAKKAIELKQNKPYHFTKYAIYIDSKDPQRDLKDEYESMVKQHLNMDYQTLLKEHEACLAPWLEHSLITLKSDDETLEATINYNLYQLFTLAPPNAELNIPAKGLSSDGYEGHTFWDTEIYLLPYFMQVDQNTTKRLLRYRYNQLTKAKEEARNLGVEKGVKFAWRTINGTEASAYFPAGSAQYHINADIAYSFIQYYKLYRDETFMAHFGREVLLQTARFFIEVLQPYEGKYHLHHATGPDEYSALVDDNYYTNSLIQYQFAFMVEDMKTHDYKALSPQEKEAIKAIAKDIYLPFDQTLNIDLQDQNFLARKPWDFKTTPKEKYPLLLHYHPLKIYRHQVLKQPDVVLSHVLLNNRPLAIQKASFDFYEPLTTHDSSLSYCIHSIQAARLKDTEKAMDYFYKVVTLDMENGLGNTQYGLHLANMGGIYKSLLQGFIGYDIADGVSIAPKLPTSIKQLKMKIRVSHQAMASLDLSREKLILKADADCRIKLYDQWIDLQAAQPKTTYISN